MMSNSTLLLALKEKIGKWVGLLAIDTRKERLIMEGRGVSLDFIPSVSISSISPFLMCLLSQHNMYMKFICVYA